MSSTCDDGQHRLAAVVAVLVGIAICFLSAVVAYRFGAILGVADTDKEVLGAFGVAVISGKTLMPFAITAAWRQSRWVLWLAAIATLFVCVVCSLSSSFGYGAVQRATSERESLHADMRNDDLASLPYARPAKAIEPLIKVERNKVKKAALESELAIARERDRLQSGLGHTAPGSEAQVKKLADLSGWSPATIRAMLLGALALAFEMLELTTFTGASALWFGGGGGRQVPQPDRQVETQAPPVALKPVESQPASNITTLTPRKAGVRVTMRRWIEQHLDEADTTTPMAAYKAYATEWTARRRTVSPELKFSRMLQQAAAERGMIRASNAGRISYRKVA